jgi:hypothetical protein
VKGTYSFVPNQPRVTVFLPSDKGAALPNVTVKRIRNAISVIVPGAPLVEFQYEEGVWKAVQP